jgi:hypothetical protein
MDVSCKFILPTFTVRCVTMEGQGIESHCNIQSLHHPVNLLPPSFFVPVVKVLMIY